MFFAFIGLKLSLFTILIAHVVFCIPFAYLPIRARLEGMDPRLAEAAADLYASPWKAFWKWVNDSPACARAKVGSRRTAVRKKCWACSFSPLLNRYMCQRPR